MVRPGDAEHMRPQRKPKASNPMSSGTLRRRASAGTPTMIAMTIANFAMVGRASKWGLSASSHCIVICVEQQQLNSRTVFGEHAEIGAAGDQRRAEREAFATLAPASARPIGF